jgi:hypothetical protein
VLPSDFFIGLILAFTLFQLAALVPAIYAQEDSPPNLAKLAAHRETETEAERNEYMYRHPPCQYD